MKKIAVTSIAILATISGSILKAEPGEVIATLMRQPASVMDLGLLKLKNDVLDRIPRTSDVVSGYEVLNVLTFYEEEDDTIVIRVVGVPKKSEDPVAPTPDFKISISTGMKICEEWFERIRARAGVHDGSIDLTGRSRFTSLFVDRNKFPAWSLRDRLEFAEELDKKFRINVGVPIVDNEGDFLFMECNGTLVGEDMSYKMH